MKSPKQKLNKKIECHSSGKKPLFDLAYYLKTAAKGRNVTTFQKRSVLFKQDDEADSVIYIQSGKSKVTIVSEEGYEAVMAVLRADEFLGESCLVGQQKRLVTASAMTDCKVMIVAKIEIQRVLQNEPAF